MSIEQDRNTATDALNKLMVAKGDAQRKMNAAANKLRRQARDQQDQAIRRQMERQANTIARKAIDLNQENFRLMHTRNRILRSQSLSGVLSQLRALVGDAKQTVQSMQQVSQILGAAADLINMIRRFAALIV